MHKGVKGGICSKYAVKHKKVKPLDIFFKKTCTPPEILAKNVSYPQLDLYPCAYMVFSKYVEIISYSDHF